MTSYHCWAAPVACSVCGETTEFVGQQFIYPGELIVVVCTCLICGNKEHLFNEEPVVASSWTRSPAVRAAVEEALFTD